MLPVRYAPEQSVTGALARDIVCVQHKAAPQQAVTLPVYMLSSLGAASVTDSLHSEPMKLMLKRTYRDVLLDFEAT